MAEVVKNVREFVSDRPWGAKTLSEIDGATVRLHWTDRPYRWHVNDGAEVFVVLDGAVEMRYRHGGTEERVQLNPSDIFIAAAGDEHVAHPIGQARILVIERKGSV
ncbi:MAG TPA: cupin [Stellaceae bacterium]|nr:cupin [Stellaceae bacterium]